MALFPSTRRAVHRSFARAVILLATSARADPPSPSQNPVQSYDRTAEHVELGVAVSNDDASIKLATNETKHSTGPDPGKVPVNVNLTSNDAGPSAGVRVRIATDDPRVTLFRLIDRIDVGEAFVAGVAFIPVIVMSKQPVPECEAPCDKSVDPRFAYLVAGKGITPSSPFAFPRGPSAYDLKVDAGSSSAHTAGVILTTAGICLAGLGGAFLAVDAVGSDGSTGVTTAAAIGGGVGLISLAIGIPLWISNRTSVRVDPTINEVKLRLPAGMAVGAQGITF